MAASSPSQAGSDDVDMDISDDDQSPTAPHSQPASMTARTAAAAARAKRAPPPAEDEDVEEEENDDEEEAEDDGEDEVEEGEDEVEDEDEVNVEEAEEEVEEEPAEQATSDVEVDEDEPEPEEEASPSPPPVAYSKLKSGRGGAGGASLKIKFKMPAASLASSTSTPAGDEEDEDEDAEGEVDADADGDLLESEDEDDDDEEMLPGPSRLRPMTARQVAIANAGVDSERGQSTPELGASKRRGKKQDLNDTELALKREETARKRKNMSEKRLEDEKTETINRLLRKQSKPRNKRNVLASADDRDAPAGSDAGDADGDGDGSGSGAALEAREVPPTMWRWVSSARPAAVPSAGTDQAAMAADGEAVRAPARTMRIAFGVPVSVLPVLPAPPAADADAPAGAAPAPVPARAGPPTCDVGGCAERRRYRLVRDWTRGACGMGHLKVLEGAA